MNDPVGDPRFWRDRAEKTRIKAEGFRTATKEKQRLLKIAAEYERIADRTEHLHSRADNDGAR